MNTDRELVLPTNSDKEDLAEKFSKFFTDKVANIRSQLDKQSSSISHDDVHVSQHCNENVLDTFQQASIDEVKKIIMKSPSKSCSLDPIPTGILKQCVDALSPVITDIVNMSITSGYMPPCMKTAIVTPLLKKPSLDADHLNNNRPVSSLSFISKVIEKVVAARLSKHMEQYNLYEVKQSAYRKGHSTETALLRIQNDLLKAADNHHASCLVLLDLSAAFDTVDHTILLTRLSQDVGLSGVPLKWCTSYLSGRTQTIKAASSLSSAAHLACGVPQGSVLGPILFTVYTAIELGKIIRKHGLDYHMYADDTQLYISFRNDDIASALTKLENCLAEIKTWMVKNRLQLNSEKTDIVII